MNTILNLGFILLVGLLAERLIQKIKLPTVTAFIIVGILLGPSLFNLVNAQLIASSGLISNIALGIIAFRLGESFLSPALSKKSEDRSSTFPSLLPFYPGFS